MPFVKLDCGILNSTIWFDRQAREIFLTALLMAEPYELREPAPQIEANSLALTGWVVPPGWYGFVPAAGVGILHRAGVKDEAAGREALERLGSPEDYSRSKDFEGRRLVRIDGGYLLLNYIKYRERDYTSAERSKRYRERLALVASRRDKSTTRRDITQEEVDLDLDLDTKAKNKESRAVRVDHGFESWWSSYPKKTGKGAALSAWKKIKPSEPVIAQMHEALKWQRNQPQWSKDAGAYVPNPATYLNQRRWEDEPFHTSPVAVPQSNDRHAAKIQAIEDGTYGR